MKDDGFGNAIDDSGNIIFTRSELSHYRRQMQLATQAGVVWPEIPNLIAQYNNANFTANTIEILNFLSKLATDNQLNLKNKIAGLQGKDSAIDKEILINDLAAIVNEVNQVIIQWQNALSNADGTFRGLQNKFLKEDHSRRRNIIHISPTETINLYDGLDTLIKTATTNYAALENNKNLFIQKFNELFQDIDNTLVKYKDYKEVPLAQKEVADRVRAEVEAAKQREIAELNKQLEAAKRKNQEDEKARQQQLTDMKSEIDKLKKQQEAAMLALHERNKQLDNLSNKLTAASTTLFDSKEVPARNQQPPETQASGTAPRPR